MALELDVDEGYYRASWRAERIGWLCILVIVLAGLAGAAGRGPLSRTVAGTGEFRVDYERVLRRNSPGTMQVRLGTVGTTDTVVRLWASRALLEACEVQRVMPTPVQVVDAGARSVFFIRTQPGADSATVTIQCEAAAVGRYDGRLGVIDGPAVPVRMWVLP